MPALEHPSEAKLAAVLNEAMPPGEVERILEHLDDCKLCEGGWRSWNRPSRSTGVSARV